MKQTLILALLFSFLYSFSQEKNIEIKQVKINYEEGCQGCIDVYFSFRDIQSNNAVEIEDEQDFNTNFRVFESINNNRDNRLELSPGSFDKFDPEEAHKINDVTKVEEEFKLDVTIYLGLDLSGSVTPEMLETAKKAIQNLVFNDNISDGQVYLYTFHDEISAVQPITKSNYDAVLGAITSTHNQNYEVDTDKYGDLGEYYSNTSRAVQYRYNRVVKTYDTNLNNAIAEKVQELELLSKRQLNDETATNSEKILILLTDGRDDVKDNPDFYFGIKEHYSEEKVSEIVQGSDVTVYTVGLGNKVDAKFLENVALANNKGSYYYAELPNDLGTVYNTIGQKVLPDYKVTIVSESCLFRGNKRTYTIEYNKSGGGFSTAEAFECRLGDPNHIQSNCSGNKIDPNPSNNKLLSLFWGLGIVFLIFLALALLFPFIKKQIFRSKYVTKYVKEIDEERICPYCANEFQTGEKIVVKCEHIMHLECWEENGNKCTEYPHLCSVGVEENYSFKDFLNGRKGSEIAIWGFFGAVGGLLSFMPITSDPTEGSSFMKPLINSINSDASDYALNSLSIGAEHGLILGFFLTLLFSLAENKKGLNITTVGLSVLRAIIGAVFGSITYYLGTLLGNTIGLDYFNQIIPLVFFGIAVGAALSFKSSVTLRNGIIGGLVASFVASTLYYFLFVLTGGLSFDIIVLKFILFGLLIGAIISTVLKALESFYLEYLSGNSMGKTVPVSKWMMEGLEVFIGASRGSHVVVNNIDGVADQHAVMRYNKEANESFIRSVKDNEVYVNNRAIPFNLEYRIRNNDIIAVGYNQMAKFKYAEKR